MINVLSHPIVQFLGLLVLRFLVKRQFQNNSVYRLALDVTFFAALTALLFVHRISPYVPDDATVSVSDRISNGGLKTIWWAGAALMLASSVRLFLILEGKPREARLLQDIFIAVIYLSAGLCIVAYVFSLPIGTLVATSGVFAIVLGLALQNTLGDVFSGIALNLGRPISPGHWIVLDDNVQGQVFETNWRSTQIRTVTNDVVFVPNSLLARSRFTNTSYPDTSHGSTLTVRLAMDRTPNRILEAMETVLLSSNTIDKTPPPLATIRAIDKDFIEVDLAFRVGDVGKVATAKNELFDLIYRHAQSIELQLASSARHISVLTKVEDKNEVVSSRRLLNTITMFSSLTEDERNNLAGAMVPLNFGKGDVIAHHGSALTSLMILKSGVISVEKPEDQSTTELARLAPGDVFGERGVLLGALEIGNKIALTPVVVCEISKERLADLFKKRPAIAEELAVLLAVRSKSQESLHQVSKIGSDQSASVLSARMRQLFHLGRRHYPSQES